VPPAPAAADDSPLDIVRGPVDRLLDTFLDERVRELVALDPALEPVGREAAALVRAGGKRLRPAFVYWGWRAAGASGGEDDVLRVGAAVELLHTFALVHDDVMDRSDERRGRAALHRALATEHEARAMIGDPDWFGLGAAILAGDLVFVWSDALFDSAQGEPETIARARAVFTELRIEVMAGQYLDLRLAGLPAAAPDDARRVALLKSGRYTVTRPLLLGAALAAPSPSVAQALAEYGDELGIAFQLRDDVLGLFGDPTATGKGALADVREGKRTLLVLRALALADPAGRAVLERTLGNARADEASAAKVREVVAACGALDAVEGELGRRLEIALGALERVPEPARAALAQLARGAAHRES
jgi:geranylgeranyl diphosphate synthase type I